MSGFEIFSRTGEVSRAETVKPEAEKTVKSEAGTAGNKARARFDKIFGDIFEKADFYTTYKERLDHVPAESDRTHWKGEKGESLCVPVGETEAAQKARDKLSEYGKKGVKYENGVPKFSPFSEATVKDINMTADRPKNFDQADKKTAEQWNADARDGRTDWTQQTVEQYRKENNLSWHECNDTKTMQLVPHDIHEFFNHSGGVAECKKRDAVIDGGEFDDHK